MNIHDATECAYKNGYEKGYEQGVKDFAERVKKYYWNLGSKTNSVVVAYYADQIAKELTEKNAIDN